MLKFGIWHNLARQLVIEKMNSYQILTEKMVNNLAISFFSQNPFDITSKFIRDFLLAPILPKIWYAAEVCTSNGYRDSYVYTRIKNFVRLSEIGKYFQN